MKNIVEILMFLLIIFSLTLSLDAIVAFKRQEYRMCAFKFAVATISLLNVIVVKLSNLVGVTK